MPCEAYSRLIEQEVFQADGDDMRHTRTNKGGKRPLANGKRRRIQALMSHHGKCLRGERVRRPERHQHHLQTRRKPRHHGQTNGGLACRV